MLFTAMWSEQIFRLLQYLYHFATSPARKSTAGSCGKANRWWRLMTHAACGSRGLFPIIADCGNRLIIFCCFSEQCADVVRMS